MHEIRIHGRGGQGVVTMAELLAGAAFSAGHEAQAFPSFGSERMGAPVMSFVRISDEPIQLRDPVLHPDVLIVADPTLLHHVDVFAGIGPGTTVLLNSSRTPAELGLDELSERVPGAAVITIAATEIARRFTGRPLPTGPLLGAVAAVTGLVSLDAVEAALGRRFPPAVAASNSAAARHAADLIQPVQENAHA